MRKPINIHTWKLKGHFSVRANESYSLWKILGNMCMLLFDNHRACATTGSESLVLLCKQEALPHLMRIYLLIISVMFYHKRLLFYQPH